MCCGLFASLNFLVPGSYSAVSSAAGLDDLDRRELGTL